MGYKDNEFQRELTHLLNKYCVDVDMDMPDYIIAWSLVQQLDIQHHSHQRRLRWQSRKPWEPGETTGKR